MTQLSDILSGPTVLATCATCFPNILTDPISTPHDFMVTNWARYPQGNPGMNGKIFEALLTILFFRLGLTPLYTQAKLAFIPNVEFDFVLYSQEHGPVVLSAKTSLRERYKQADLEGMMLRQVHRKSKSSLITMNITEAATVNKKIQLGQVLGLDSVVVASDPSFDVLLQSLQQFTLLKPDPIEVITGKIID